MRLALIQQRIDFYEANRSTFSGIFSDPEPIANLKLFAASLAPEAKEGKSESKSPPPDRDLTPAEICRLYTTVLLPSEQKSASEATTMALNALKSAADDHYRFCQVLHRKNLVTEANLTALNTFSTVPLPPTNNTRTLIPSPFENVRRTWTLIFPELHNQNTFDMVMQYGPYLDVLNWTQRNRDDFVMDNENALTALRQNLQTDALEKAFKRIMLMYFEKKLGPATLNKLPQNFRTRANLEKLANNHLELNSRNNFKYNQFDKYPVSLRERIADAISALPVALQTQENLNFIFDNYEYAGIVKDDFIKLPIALQTQTNFRTLVYNPKYLYGISGSINRFLPELQTQENFNHLVTAINMVSQKGAYGVSWFNDQFILNQTLNQADINRGIKTLRANVTGEKIDNNDLPPDDAKVEQNVKKEFRVEKNPEKEYKQVLLASSGVLPEASFDIEEQALTDALIASLSPPPATSLSITTDFSNSGAHEIKADYSPVAKVDFSNMEDNLTCAITGYIFKNPVILLSSEAKKGGHTVEEDVAKDLIARGMTNPTDRSVISDYVENYLVKALVTDYLALNPEAGNRIYKGMAPALQLSPQGQPSPSKLRLFDSSGNEFEAYRASDAKEHSNPPSPSSSNK